MDEEESFAKLLSQSTTAAAPSWNTTQADDPWANPFSDSTPSSNPFASPFGTSSAYVSAASSDPYVAPMALPESPRENVSPYVSRIEEDEAEALGQRPDMPSVIAAREQETYTQTAPAYSNEYKQLDDQYLDRGESVPPPISQQKQDQPVNKALPSDLIDEDLLAASDPSASLKKAFVKSTPSTTKKDTSKEPKSETKAYVFTPGKKGSAKEAEKKAEVGPEVKHEAVKEKSGEGHSEMKEEDQGVEQAEKREAASEEVQPEDAKGPEASTTDGLTEGADSGVTSLQQSTGEEASSGAKEPTPTPPAAIPLPESALPTPTATRPASPVAPASPARNKTPAPNNETEPSPSVPFTPSSDRVAVSPLDPPPQQPDYGFQSLSIGASSIAPPPPPPKSPVRTDSRGWTSQATSPPGSRFAGKGWGAIDEDEGGLFGKGGPSVRNVAADPWGSSNDAAGSGWGEPGVASLPSPPPRDTGSSTVNIVRMSMIRIELTRQAQTPTKQSAPLPEVATPTKIASTAPSGSPRTPKLLSKPLFQISVGDPTRVGDPVRGYTVYTVRTRTTSPHYRKGEFSVLRRFSDFLWLFETLTANNPGVIVPPVPDKHPFGRFQDTFIETRRLALQRALTKITAHPVLQLDPDLRMFLESDHFATDSKNRRAESQQEAGNKGLLSSWTGSKFVEQDDWFDSRRAFLDSLESQLKSLSKSLETASKARLDMANSMTDFASSISALADSDLGSAMCAGLARLSDLAHREKEANEEQAKAEVINLLNLSDEYVRFIASVRLAFAGRIKSYERWQTAEKEVTRLRGAREKARQQGKLGDRGPQSLAEIGDVSFQSHLIRPSGYEGFKLISGGKTES